MSVDWTFSTFPTSSTSEPMFHQESTTYAIQDLEYSLLVELCAPEPGRKPTRVEPDGGAVVQPECLRSTLVQLWQLRAEHASVSARLFRRLFTLQEVPS